MLLKLLVQTLAAALASALLAAPASGADQTHCAAGSRVQATYEFGHTVQRAVERRDLDALFAHVDGELANGPRRRFVRDKRFDDIFPDSWRQAVIADEPACEEPGWRGYMLGNGRVWYDFASNADDLHIFSINGAEVKPVASPDIGWRVDDALVPPQCFAKIWMSADNYEAFEDRFAIADHADFRAHPGRYFGREIGSLDPIDAPWGGEKVALARSLAACFAQTGSTGPNTTHTAPVVETDTVSSRSCDSAGYCTDCAYRLLAPIPPAKCQKLAPHLPGVCEDANLVRIGDYGGGTIGWDVQAIIYGLFALEDGRRFVVPLANFPGENDARNFVDGLPAGR